MHREEGQVEPDEHQHELDLADGFVEHPPGHLREVEVEPGHHAEDGAAEQHVVEMGDHPVRVMNGEVHRHRRTEGAVDPADQEHAQKAQGKQQRR